MISVTLHVRYFPVWREEARAKPEMRLRQCGPSHKPTSRLGPSPHIAPDHARSRVRPYRRARIELRPQWGHEGPFRPTSPAR